LKSNYQLWLKLKKARQEELDALISSGAEQGRKEIKEAINECVSLMKSVKQEFWQLFECLLDGPLVEGWKKIIKDKCDGECHVVKGGIKKSAKRGRTFTAMHACIRVWLLNIMRPNAAERHHVYMQTQIRLPARGCSIKAFISRIVEINGYAKFLPCLKDVEGSPEQLKRMDRPFTELELCNIVLQAIPYPFACAFWANKGAGHFPVDLRVMTEDLALHKPEFKRTQGVVEKLSGGPQTTYQKSSTEEKGGSKRKAKPNPQNSDKKNSDKSKKHKQGNKKLCKLCKQWSPNWKHTHKTGNCHHWDKTGNHLEYAKQANAISQDKEKEILNCFAQMQKDNRKLLKKLSKTTHKSSKKKKRKSNGSSSDSDSSDSE
jgi:hypothetical protein